MMDCRQTQSEMTGAQLSLEALQHLETCEACRSRLCAEQTLTDALAETPSYDAPASLETAQALLAAVRPRRTNRLLLAAALILVAGPLLWFALRSPRAPQVVLAPQERLARTTPFFVLDPLSPDVAAGRGRLIRARLPAEAPVAYGLQIPSTDGSVEADVLLGEDGSIYAVRFVY